MTGLHLPALDGRTPLGFLAALGVLRLVTEHTEHNARLAWSRQDCTAFLHGAQPDIDTLVADLTSVVQEIPTDGILPDTPPDFPPPGEAPDRLRLTRTAYADYAHTVSVAGGPVAERWLTALVTDLSIDDKQRIDTSLYAAPSGKQSTRTMLEKPLQLIRQNTALLREAVLAWRRYPGVSGEYLDHRVLFDAADAADGKPAERGVPGATWLALMAHPLMRTVTNRTEPLTTCWQDLGRSGGRRMIHPLWSTPLSLPTVQALLTHPVFSEAKPGPPPPASHLLSVFWIGHAIRRQVPSRKFAGVLTPITTLPPPQPRPAAKR